jgi:hypothetical protein
VKNPTVAEVVAADREQVAFWWCFLPEPKTPEEERAPDLIFMKHCVTGGISVTEPRDKGLTVTGLTYNRLTLPQIGYRL